MSKIRYKRKQTKINLINCEGLFQSLSMRSTMIQPGMWYQGIIFNLRFLENDSRHVVAKITHHKEAEKLVKICKNQNLTEIDIHC